MPRSSRQSPDVRTFRRLAGVWMTVTMLAACGGGGGGGSDTPPPQTITPGTETLAAVDVTVTEGQTSAPQRVLVSNTGAVGNFSFDVLPTGVLLALSPLVPGGVELNFSVQGVTGNNPQIEVRYCNVAPCTATNSLRRIVPVRLTVTRGLTWQLPERLLFGGQGLPLAAQTIGVNLPAEAGALEVQALESLGSSTASAWLQASVQAGTSAASRNLVLTSPRAASLALGDYAARLQARYVFADGRPALELATDFRLLVRPPGCRLPESSPGTRPELGAQWGPRWSEFTGSLAVRIECWGIAPTAATASVDAPWLTTAVRGSGLQTDVLVSLDPAQAASLPANLRPALQLRIASAVQADVLIPFFVDVRFPDVLTVTPGSVRAGTATEVLLSGANLDTQLTPLLLDAQGQRVPGVTLTPVRQQACGIGGCEVFVAVPALAAGDWFIGFEQAPGVRRPAGLLRVTAN